MSLALKVRRLGYQHIAEGEMYRIWNAFLVRGSTRIIYMQLRHDEHIRTVSL